MRSDTLAPPRPEARFRLRQLLAGSAVVALLVACEVPTEPPEVETRWVVPAEETRFGVAELLPGDVSLTPDSSAFVVDFDPVGFSATLGGLCPACALADGATVPKPAFDGTFESDISFPPEVLSIEVIDGQVELELFNGFNFDPIRPASGVFGSLELSLIDDNDDEVLGTLTIDGVDTAFGTGTTLVRSLDLVAATVEGPIVASVRVASPTGDPVTIDASDLVSVNAAPMNVRVGSVEIDVAGRSVDLDPVALDLEDVDQELIDRVVSGAFVLDVTNPFAVSADFQITISGPTFADIQKSASIGEETESEVTIAFTQAEIRRFLGEPSVVLSGGAVVDAGAGPVRVDPGQELILSAALDVILLIGG